MNCKTQVALAAGAGYLLGRQRKLRWGLLLAAAAMTGRLSRPGAVLDHGLRALKATPELGKLGEMGAPLVTAARDAARTAVTGRIDSLSGKLRERAGKGVAEPESTSGSEEREEPAEAPARRSRPAGGARRSRPRADEDEYADEEQYADEEDEDQDQDEEEEDEELVPAGRRPGRRPPVRRRGEG